DNHAKSRGENIDERCSLTVQSIESDQDLRKRQRQRFCVADDRSDRTQEFASILSIASVAKGAQPLIAVGLQHGGSGSHHFSPFASGVAGSTDQIHATVGGRQLRCLWQRPVSCDLFGSVYISDSPTLPLAIQESTR